MKASNNSCQCGAAPKLIFPCSGAADVGEIADRAARKLTREGAGSMYCLAGIGGGVSGIVGTTEAASKILVIDGCSQDCGKKTLEHRGLEMFEHLRVTDMGMEKGETPATEECVATVAARGAEKLAT